MRNACRGDSDERIAKPLWLTNGEINVIDEEQVLWQANGTHEVRVTTKEV